jgi:hypothetical protein
MDHATLLAENKERERQFRLQLAMQVAPPWPVREDSVVPFAWPFTARDLIAERKRVCEILALRATVENVRIGDSNAFILGVPVSFHEAFVCSHGQRLMLTKRVHKHYDTYWKPAIVSMYLESFPDTAPKRFGNEAALEKAMSNWSAGVASYYGMGASLMTRHIEALLQMQALSEELTPETRELVTRCSSFEQLDRSMLAMESMQEAMALQQGFTFNATGGALFTTPSAFR